MVKTVAVDFDGVVHRYSRGWHDGSIYDEPIPGAIDRVRHLMSYCAVFIHTTRPPRQVARWIENHSGPEGSPRRIRCVTRVPRSGFWNRQDVLLITNRKLPGVAYLDDRAIRFESWRQAFADLQRFEGFDIDPIGLTD